MLSGCFLDDESLQGFVEADITYLSSPTTGKLSNLLFKEGENIKQGDLVFKLKDQSFDDIVNAAKSEYKYYSYLYEDSKKGQAKEVVESIDAQIAQAVAALELSNKRLDRAKKLKAKGAIDQDAYDSFNEQFLSAKFFVKQLQFNLLHAKDGARIDQIAANREMTNAKYSQWQQNKKRKIDMDVRSPISGFVIETYYEVGEWVAAMQPVASIVSPENYYVKFYLPIAKLGDLKVGQEIFASMYNSKEKLKLKVKFINKQAEYTPPMVYAANNISKYVYEVKASILNNTDNKLNLGQPVFVSINNDR